MKKYINKEENKHLKFNVGTILIARKSMKNNKKTVRTGDLVYSQAITLISLVITIILLILLAGVAINLGLGENGIFNKVKQAKEQYTESIAKEKLEMVLLDVIAEKGTNSEYNNGQFLDDMLKANGIEVQGDNVIIDNYIFTIDRDNLGVTQSLGQTQIKVTKEVQKYLGKNANDKYEAQLLVIVESNTKLQKIEITNPNGTTFEIETNQEKIAKDLTVEFDEEYKIEITDKTGKKETRTIVERKEEGIRTAEELAEFRDKVNTGLTYEGKIINLLKDIDLSSVCGENVNGEEISWEPIGKGYKNSVFFSGTFNGNYYVIRNLYIKSSAYKYCGLFTYISSSTEIKNVIMKDCNIYNNNTQNDTFSGGIAGINEGMIYNCAIETGNIVGNNLLRPNEYIGVSSGGIAGVNWGLGEINNCYNKALISSTCYNGVALNNEGVEASVGGIVGINRSKIYNCYNSGNIKSEGGYVIKLGGISGQNAAFTESKIINCYNYGKINIENKNYSGLYMGGIEGNNVKGTITNSYYEENTANCAYNIKDTKIYNGKKSATELKSLNTILGESYIDDIDNINDGYPILKWQADKYNKNTKNSKA